MHVVTLIGITRTILLTFKLLKSIPQVFKVPIQFALLLRCLLFIGNIQTDILKEVYEFRICAEPFNTAVARITLMAVVTLTTEGSVIMSEG